MMGNLQCLTPNSAFNAVRRTRRDASDTVVLSPHSGPLTAYDPPPTRIGDAAPRCGLLPRLSAGPDVERHHTANWPESSSIA